MTSEAWRYYDPVDGDVDWRAIRADGGVVAGLVKLGRSTVVYTYDPRLAALDGARFASAGAARGAVAATLAAPETPPIAAAALTPLAISARPGGHSRDGKAERSARRLNGAGAGFYDA